MSAQAERLFQPVGRSGLGLVAGSRSRWTIVGVVVVLAATPWPTARAQRAQPAPPEFTRQGLLITNLNVAGGDRRNGARVADRLRGLVSKATNKRDLEVIDGDDIDFMLERSGYRTDSTLDLGMIHTMGKFFRADEYLAGSVSAQPGGVRLRAELVLMRDAHLRQPLGEARAPKLNDAADHVGVELTAALTQLVYERRCENALHDGHAAAAVEHARGGVAAYPRSTIARVCLLWALGAVHAPHEDVLQVAREVLAIDSTSYYAIESEALALDSLHRAREAGDAWLRLAQTDTTDLDLAERVIYSLSEDGNGQLAEPLVRRLAAAHPDELQLVREQWKVAFDNHDWPVAIEAGEVLMARDTLAVRDSTFYRRLATAYHESGNLYRAVEFVARGVATFPGDAHMYALYAQYIRAEADTVLPRGIALFPRSTELIAMVAQDLRQHGKAEESLVMTKRMLEVDSTIAQGNLVVAQSEFDLGRPDSALAALHRALVHGDDSALVAQFALSKGNRLYVAANGTRTSTDFLLAFRFVSLADSVHTSSASQLLVGATALGAAQGALTEAVKLPDKVQGCARARMGSDLLPVARAGLEAGRTLAPEGAQEQLKFLDQLDPYAAEQVKALCAAP